MRANRPLREEILAAITEVCDSGRFVFGPDCQQLEQDVAAFCGAKHAVGCASGSDAILLALMACGIGAGDEVITPSFTFFATASAVWRLGATPVFVDIDPASFNIDPECVAQAITPRTKAIIPVHLFGQCTEMAPLIALGRRHQISIIEDCAQAIGASYQGRGAGAIGDVGCFSFYPTKNLGGFGDGGMLTTNSDQLADQFTLLRGHGMRPRYYHQVVGINSRLDSIQAAVLNVKFRHLAAWNQQRNDLARRYGELFAEYGLLDAIVLPATVTGEHVWNQYTIRISGHRRDSLREHLTQRGVGTEIFYPAPLHLQQCFEGLGIPKGALPETERAAEEVLCLPIFPELTHDEQNNVVSRIGEYFAACGAGAGRRTA